jgi:threonine dehydrogenase-like Zn-dependent dehydrogenase
LGVVAGPAVHAAAAADRRRHRRYVPGLLAKIAAGTADPLTVWTREETMPGVLDAYQAFDRRDPGWTKVTLELG